MGFTTEEIGMIDGVMCSHLLPRFGADALRERYLTLHWHLAEGQLEYTDLLGIREMLALLFPVFHGARQFEKDICSLQAKTNMLLKSSAR